MKPNPDTEAGTDTDRDTYKAPPHLGSGGHYRGAPQYSHLTIHENLELYFIQQVPQ